MTAPQIFNAWHSSLRIVLSVAAIYDYLYKPCPDHPPETATAEEKAAWKAEYKKHSDVACIMLGKMSPALQRQFVNYHTPNMLATKLQNKCLETSCCRKIYDLVDAYLVQQRLHNPQEEKENPNKDQACQPLPHAGLERGRLPLFISPTSASNVGRSLALVLQVQIIEEKVRDWILLIFGTVTSHYWQDSHAKLQREGFLKQEVELHTRKEIKALDLDRGGELFKPRVSRLILSGDGNISEYLLLHILHNNWCILKKEKCTLTLRYGTNLLFNLTTLRYPFGIIALEIAVLAYVKAVTIADKNFQHEICMEIFLKEISISQGISVGEIVIWEDDHIDTLSIMKTLARFPDHLYGATEGQASVKGIKDFDEEIKKLWDLVMYAVRCHKGQMWRIAQKLSQSISSESGEAPLGCWFSIEVHVADTIDDACGPQSEYMAAVRKRKEDSLD
ncbi:hypothetical protein Tco_1522212 [Tanacetum coccineum]